MFGNEYDTTRTQNKVTVSWSGKLQILYVIFKTNTVTCMF